MACLPFEFGTKFRCVCRKRNTFLILVLHYILFATRRILASMNRDSFAHFLHSFTSFRSVSIINHHLLDVAYREIAFAEHIFVRFTAVCSLGGIETKHNGTRRDSFVDGFDTFIVVLCRKLWNLPVNITNTGYSSDALACSDCESFLDISRDILTTTIR